MQRRAGPGEGFRDTWRRNRSTLARDAELPAAIATDFDVFSLRRKTTVRPLCAGRTVSPSIVAASLAISIPPPPAAAPSPMTPAAAAPSPMAPLDLRNGIGRLCEVADNRAIDRHRRHA